jgi:hypothetical protein
VRRQLALAGGQPEWLRDRLIRPLIRPRGPTLLQIR